MTPKKSAALTIAAVWGLLLLSLMMSALLGGCATHPAKPPAPPVPALHAVAVSIMGSQGPIGGAQLSLDNNAGPAFIATTNADGYAVWTDVPIVLVDSQLTITADGYLPYSQHVSFGTTNQTIRVGDGRSEPQDLVLPALDADRAHGPPIAGRVRAVNGHFVNDAGPFLWLGISEFDFVHLVRTGNEAELQRRLRRDIAIGHRNVFRVFARAVNLFDLNADLPNYWDALDRTIAILAEAGGYTELVLLPDAQSLSETTRRTLVQAYGERYRNTPSVLYQITNEPWQNGWTKATDPALLSLGDLLASVIGHRDFSIADPQDGDTTDASVVTQAEAVTLGQHSNIIVIHSSRMGGAAPWDDRFRRYIDHGESFYDVIRVVRQMNRNAACVNDEPMGVASQRWVPIPGRAPYEREYQPEAVLADELTTLIIGCGHTFHYVSSQDDGTPGLDLIGQLSPHLSADGSWTYYNDSWAGSATRGFSGFGKVRTTSNGSQGVTLANGTQKGRVTWANGFAPVATWFDGEHVTLWQVAR